MPIEIICLPFSLFALATPKIARLSDSVPPAVKTMVSGMVPRPWAIVRRASLIAPLLIRPNLYKDDGLA